jgi:hypothetical protein
MLLFFCYFCPLFLDFILAYKDRALDLKKEDFSPILLYKNKRILIPKKKAALPAAFLIITFLILFIV